MPRCRRSGRRTWREASRLDLDGVIRTMTDVVRDVAAADAGRAREKAAMLDELLDGALL